jgi:hypothetical protein
MYDLGAFPGAVNLIGWTGFNAYAAIIQADHSLNSSSFSRASHLFMRL